MRITSETKEGTPNSQKHREIHTGRALQKWPTCERFLGLKVETCQVSCPVASPKGTCPGPLVQRCSTAAPPAAPCSLYLSNQSLVLCHQLVEVLLVFIDALQEISFLMLQLVQLFVQLGAEHKQMSASNAAG